MAARKKIFHDENTRLKIKASQIINRLNNHILAEPEKDKDGKLILTSTGCVYKDLMTQSQVTAALGLLKKAVPDLQSIELTGNEDKPLTVIGQIQLVRPKD